MLRHIYWAAFLAFVASAAYAQAGGLADLRIETRPGETRSFILANRNGTYLYGATNEPGWDDGWMGLWVNRQRVLSRFTVSDSAGSALTLTDARCRITPFDVTWTWDTPRADLSLSFLSTASDTVCFTSTTGARAVGEPWMQPASYDSEMGQRILRWVVSSDSREPAPVDYLPEKLRGEISAAHFHCADNRYSEAVAWAHVQLLFLLAEDDSLLYAGIPWFNEGWGRDTFISLPGLLVTGHTDAARKILLRFTSWLDRNPSSPTYGRIPNRVRPGEDIAYNTADGTPWWILGLYTYGLYARDYDLWARVLSDSGGAESGSLKTAVRGALARCDSLGLLTHGDAETWMDAVGPAGPYTPRGNRAVDIQALHYAALDAAIRMASATKALSRDSLNVWRDARRRIELNFLGSYLARSEDRLYDRLKADGTPDSSLRPNQLFALTTPLSPLIPPQIQSAITRTVCSDLAHPYGVLSLSADDPNFHPYHLDEHYPKDDAYHTGIVWTWLSGPAKTALRREGRGDLALQLADFEADLLHERGCAGSLPEVTDAVPRRGQKLPALSGTVSQAWSLAEFLRTTYQDLLGIRPVQVSDRVEPFWLIDPRIPESWGRVEARVILEGTPVIVTEQNFGDSVSITLRAEREPAQPLGIKAFDAEQGITGLLRTTDPVHLVYVPSKQIAYADGAPTASVKLRGWPYDPGPQDVKLAPPIRRSKFASLQPPAWDVLTAKQTRFHEVGLIEQVICEGDSCGDDKGTGSYVYPLDSHFAPQILDILKFAVIEHRRSLNFRLMCYNLVQPGWHPEYGFQLTFAAICLHTSGGKRTAVGANSDYVFPAQNPFSRVIYVGGGLRVEDDEGKTLAVFTPRTREEALGDTTRCVIEFSIPKKYFPKHALDGGWTVLVGAQDDHGGAGMGEFRAVKAVAEQWAGGGNVDGGPNVYDTLYIPPRENRPKVIHDEIEF